MSVESIGIWDQVLSSLRKGMDEESFRTWIEPVEFLGRDEFTVRLGLPSVFFRNWISANYQDRIETCLGILTGGDVEVRYEILGDDTDDGEETDPPAPGDEDTGARQRLSIEAALRPFDIEGIQLNDRCNFQSFVVGESNRFAYTAAMAVADPQKSVYNPLFIYGGTGLGKTHLLHAIGQRMLSMSPTRNVLCVSSETFMNAFIEGIQQKDLTHFRNLFRTVDLLLIDDVQFFAGAERTQTEFFHTFNALFNAGKKIVISSDRPPKELHELEERLRSRFEAGLIVDVQPPDLETRVAILRKKSRELNLEIVPDIEIFIAERIKTNIRKLEGALVRIQAHAGLSGKEITREVVRDVLGESYLGDEPLKISVEKIQLAVCRFFDINLHDLTGTSRTRKFAWPRQLACYLAREMTELSFPEIARKFGGRDHTSILHAHRKVCRELEKDLGKQNLIKYLTRLIKEDPAGPRTRS